MQFFRTCVHFFFGNLVFNSWKCTPTHIGERRQDIFVVEKSISVQPVSTMGTGPGTAVLVSIMVTGTGISKVVIFADIILMKTKQNKIKNSFGFIYFLVPFVTQE